MQSSPPHSEGKARALRELSASLNHSSRSLSPVLPPPSDSNPTRHSGFGDTTDFFQNSDVLMSTQHKIEEDTNTLPRHPRIRSTAKKVNSWRMMHSEQPGPDTSMVNKEFGDFDHSVSDDEDRSIEQARGGHRSNRSTPAKGSSRGFDSLYDMTPPTARSRKSFPAETGSLRRDAQIRRASRTDMEVTASPRPASTRNSPLLPVHQERKRPSLAQLHAKVSEDESSFMEERPPTVTLQHTKSTRWGNPRSRQTSLQLDGIVDASPRVHATPRSRAAATQNATAQSFILPDLPNLTELVSGVFEDGTPVFSKTAPSRSRFTAPHNSGSGGRRPNHVPVDSVPIPQEEKAIFAALQLLQDKVAQMEHERAEADKRIEEQELELIELRAVSQAQDNLRRSDSALGSTDGEGSGKSGWRVEKTRLDATVQTLRTKLDRTERKIAVIEIEKKRLSNERDNMASQLGVAFQTCEELKIEKEALRAENEILRQEIDSLRADNEALRDQLEQEQEHHREETVQLRRQVDQTDNVTQRQNVTLQAELARVRAQHDEHTQQLTRKDIELRKARQHQAEFARLKADHESLKSQLANLKAKREEDQHHWANVEASLKAMVEQRDETIRHFQDTAQEQTNEALRLDNEQLRDELAQLAAEHEEENQRWSRKETELRRKVSYRGHAAQHRSDAPHDLLSIRRTNSHAPGTGPVDIDSVRENQRHAGHRQEENTRTRIRNRVQEESRYSRANASFQSSNIEESPRKSYSLSKAPQRTTSSVDMGRRASAPISRKTGADSDVESTTDLSLAPRGTTYDMRKDPKGKPRSVVQPPADLDLTELSLINPTLIAQLRRKLEEERVGDRGRAASAPLERPAREDTVQSQLQGGDGTIHSMRPAREDTVRSMASVKSARQPSLPRKSSLKDVTTRTATQFEEDFTGDVSNLEGDNVSANATQTKQSIVDTSMLSNTSRRRRSAPTEMTSAFIMPDIDIDTRKQITTRLEFTQRIRSKQHDDANCTVCRRQSASHPSDPLRVPKLVPVSTRMPDDIDATLRPARSPREALALVVKELSDERIHLHAELAAKRALLEAHDPSLGRRNRHEIEADVQDLLAKIKIRDEQIYNLYDVLEGQDHDITEQVVEDLTDRIRAEDAEVEKKGKEKKVTIQSFHEDEENGDLSVHDELPWEGFPDDTGEHNFTGSVARMGVY